jgi:hypothetical protein
MITIYRLRDPRDGKVRYVGQTSSSLAKRLSGHLSLARQQKLPLRYQQWMTELLGLNLLPIIESIETVANTAESHHRERYWIAEHMAAGDDVYVAAISALAMTPDQTARYIRADISVLTGLRGFKIGEAQFYSLDELDIFLGNGRQRRARGGRPKALDPLIHFQCRFPASSVAWLKNNGGSRTLRRVISQAMEADQK